MGARVWVLLLAQRLARVDLGVQELRDQDKLDTCLPAEAPGRERRGSPSFPVPAAGFENSSLLLWPCGQRSIHLCMVGGTDVELGRWPGQGSLRVWGSHHCGASLLNRRWVLLAAHCFQKQRNLSK
ncbi:Testisin [Manis javanica]|nr:Testisin [Manis javanica]